MYSMPYSKNFSDDVAINFDYFALLLKFHILHSYLCFIKRQQLKLSLFRKVLTVIQRKKLKFRLCVLICFIINEV